jgi:hypothetical protein
MFTKKILIFVKIGLMRKLIGLVAFAIALDISV